MDILPRGKPSDQREQPSSGPSSTEDGKPGRASSAVDAFEGAADWLFVVPHRDEVSVLMHCVDPALNVTWSTQRGLVGSVKTERDVIVVVPEQGPGRPRAEELAEKLRPHAAKLISWIMPELGSEETPGLEALNEKYSIAKTLAFETPWLKKDVRPAPSRNGSGHVASANGNGRHLWHDAEKRNVNYSVLTASELNIENASTIKIKPIKWVWPYRMAEGEMVLVAGEGGLGKSQVMLSIAAAITNGAMWPDRSGLAPKGRVLIITAEDSKETTIAPRLIALGADMGNVEITTAPKIVIKEGENDSYIKLQWLEDLDYWRRACDLFPDLKLLIMDPIVSYLGKGVNDQKNDEVRSVMEPFLDEIIRKRGICFLANTHLNKSLEAKNIIHRITGSIAYVNIPRNVHVVFRDSENPEMRFFAQCKCNNSPDDLPAQVPDRRPKDLFRGGRD